MTRQHQHYRLRALMPAPPRLLATWADTTSNVVITEPVVALAIEESWYSPTDAGHRYDPEACGDNEWGTRVVAIIVDEDGCSVYDRDEVNATGLLWASHLTDACKAQLLDRQRATEAARRRQLLKSKTEIVGVGVVKPDHAE